MKPDTLEFVRYKIDSEGFDYCFRSRSDFKEVKDPEFHRLRREYCAAADALDGYLPEGDDDDELEEESENENGRPEHTNNDAEDDGA